MKAEERLEALESIFAALAHKTRRQVLLVLHFRGGSMSAGEIADRFACSWPTTSRHLGRLVEAGLIRQERVGRARRYHLRRDRLELLGQWLSWFQRDPTTGGAGAHSDDLEPE